MKKDNLFLLIAVSTLLLVYILHYTAPKATVIMSILVLISGISTAIGAIIRTCNAHKWFNEDSSDKKKEKEND